MVTGYWLLFSPLYTGRCLTLTTACGRVMGVNDVNPFLPRNDTVFEGQRQQSESPACRVKSAPQPHLCLEDEQC